MQGEFAQTLGDHGDHAGVVRAGGDFVEQDRPVGEDEEFDAEDTPSGFAGGAGFGDQSFDGGFGDALGAGGFLGCGGTGVRRVGLPGFAVVAGFLTLADGCAGDDAGAGADGEYGQFAFERGERFDDDARNVAFVVGAAAFLRFGPGGVDGIRGAHDGLAVAGGAHDRLDDARVADFLGSGAQFLQGTGETVGGGGQAEFLVGEDAQAFAVHADRCDFGAGYDLCAVGGGVGEFLGGDGFHFRHDDVGLDVVEQGFELFGVGHVEYARLMGHLLCGGAGVGVGGAHPCAEAHEFDGDFLAEFAGAEEEHAGRVVA